MYGLNVSEKRYNFLLLNSSRFNVHTHDVFLNILNVSVLAGGDEDGARAEQLPGGGAVARRGPFPALRVRYL